jgi:hypothetical protein
MAITINGTGSITGLTAGGLPDGSVTADDLATDAVTSAKIATDAVTSAKIASGTIVDADVNASAAIADSKLTGTTCKAWVNFNGTGTVAIRAAYNVSSITDNGTGLYAVNFTSALPNANYAAVASSYGGANAGAATTVSTGYSVYATSGLDIQVHYSNGSSYVDASYVNVAIFR